MRLATFALLLAAVPSGSAAQSPAQPSDPIVQVGLYGYDADGKHSAAAYETPPELRSTVYLNRARCVFGGGTVPRRPTRPMSGSLPGRSSPRRASRPSSSSIGAGRWCRAVLPTAIKPRSN